MPTLPEQESHQIASQIKGKARALGFDLVGITTADPPAHQAYFQQWLKDGKAGEMNYLAKRFAERANPVEYFPGAVSVICVAVNYYAPLRDAPSDEPNGKIARYALGEDYHLSIKKRLYELADWLQASIPGTQARCAVDTAPVMEKELAARAGIGWMGKNTCIIHPKFGSWLLLGEVFTTLALPADEPAIDRCGTCTRCIDACPTHAITAPYQLNATRCISYLTIERRGDIPAEFHGKIGNWIFGCDICQDVCHHNRQPPSSTQSDMQPRFDTGTLSLHQILSWTQNEYHHATRHSAMRRVKLPMLQRNGAMASENVKRET